MDTTTVPNFTPNSESLVTETKLEENNFPNTVNKAKENGAETVRSKENKLNLHQKSLKPVAWGCCRLMLTRG